MELEADGEHIWLKQEVLKLARLYEKHTVLWDKSNPFYKKLGHKNKAIKEIAIAMGINIPEVTRKLKNLTCHYQREKKKHEEALKSGLKDNQPKWFAYKALSFLITPIQRKQENSSIDSSDSDYVIDEERGSPVKEEYEETKPVIHSPTEIQMPFQIPTEKVIEMPIQMTTDMLQMPTEMPLPIQIPKNEPQYTNQAREDEFSLFGQMVAEQLRQLPLEAALETEGMLLSVIKNQRIKHLKLNH